jgi:hypothetical protein
MGSQKHKKTTQSWENQWSVSSSHLLVGRQFLAVFYLKIAGKLTSHFHKLFFSRQNSNGTANGLHVHQSKNILHVDFVIDTTATKSTYKSIV